MKAVFVDPIDAEELASLGRLAPSVELVGARDREALTKLLLGAHVLVTRSTYVDDAMLERAGGELGLVQVCSNRQDKVAVEAAHRRGVRVALMPQRGCIAVAELALLLMLGLSKSIVRAHTATVAGAYRELGETPIRTEERKHRFQWMNLPGLFELNGLTLGLVGFGEIGTEVARRARAFGMRVLYTKRARLSASAEAREAVAYRDLTSLLEESDFVSLHVPHTDQTNRMIGGDQLASMRDTAYLINTCRGGVVDEEALVAALTSNRIAGAGLDVYLYEPVPFDHPLLGLPNVLLTPHLGGGSGGAREKHARDLMENLESVAQGKEPRFLVEGAAG